MKLPQYALVRVPLSLVAVFFAFVGIASPAHSDKGPAIVIVVAAVLGIVFARWVDWLVRRYLWNRTAALLMATAFFLFNAVDDAGREGHSTLVLTYGILAAIAFAGVVFGNRPPTPRE
jgi:hypothetical protein